MRSGTHPASDGLPIHWRLWDAVEPTRAALLLLHGVAEHCVRYQSLAHDLGRRGLSCYAFDHRGHGRSGGPRVHVDRWDRYEADVEGFVAGVVRAEGELPLFIYGHSMGALICLTGSLHGLGRRVGDFRGWIASGASLRPTGIAKPLRVAVARGLSRIWPRFRLNLGIPAASLSHDPDIVAAYEQDPLVETKATVRWGTEALRALSDIERGAGRIREPLLILHGGRDPLAEPEGSRWLAENAGAETELIIYEGALHEPHNDPAYATVATDIERWIDRRLGA